MNSFDIDGVIYIGSKRTGIFPGPSDVIITGRSYQEMPETLAMLWSRGIYNMVYFNELPFDQKTRESSGAHKAKWIRELGIDVHFEDDPVQAAVIKKECPRTHLVMVTSSLMGFENERHDKWSER